MLGNIVEFQSAQQASRFAGGKGLVQRAGRMRRQIIHHHRDPFGIGKVHIAEFAHAGGEVLCRTPAGDLHLAPGSMGVEENEQVDRPIAPILAVIAL